nr:immunoglobulin heavy chain junction region [Mus musculus]
CVRDPYGSSYEGDAMDYW